MKESKCFSKNQNWNLNQESWKESKYFSKNQNQKSRKESNHFFQELSAVGL